MSGAATTTKCMCTHTTAHFVLRPVWCGSSSVRFHNEARALLRPISLLVKADIISNDALGIQLVLDNPAVPIKKSQQCSRHPIIFELQQDNHEYE